MHFKAQNLRRTKEELDIRDEKALEEKKNMRRILTIKEAPEFLTHNPYILNGYRGCKTKKLCVERSVSSFIIHLLQSYGHLYLSQSHDSYILFAEYFYNIEYLRL